MAADWDDHFNILGVVYMIIYPLSKLAYCFANIIRSAFAGHCVYDSLCFTTALKRRCKGLLIGKGNLLTY